MPAAKPKTARERAAALGRTMGVRGVAEQLAREGFDVGKSAVAEWLREDRARRAGAAQAGPQRARGTPPRPGGEQRPAAVADAGDDQEDAEIGAEFLGADPSVLDFADLVKLDRQVTKFLLEAYRERDERRYATLARLKLEVRAALSKLRPPPKADPNSDPASLEARQAVLARLAKMLANAQEEAARRAPPG